MKFVQNTNFNDPAKFIGRPADTRAPNGSAFPSPPFRSPALENPGIFSARDSVINSSTAAAALIALFTRFRDIDDDSICRDFISLFALPRLFRQPIFTEPPMSGDYFLE